MEIIRNRLARTITLTQALYWTKALEKYNLTQCRVAETPDELVGAANQARSEEQQRPCDHQRFMEITGTLMYGGNLHSTGNCTRSPLPCEPYVGSNPVAHGGS